MIRGACYVRVSTDNQLENYSIEEQTDRLKAYCRAKDIHIVKCYTDGGYSGGNLNRPALQQMLNDVDGGSIDMIIVYKLDRLSRSQKDTLTLIEDRFLSKNVDFISINENFDTSTPFGRAMIGILSVFAQLEKDQITERFTMGRIGRAKNGYFHGGAYAPTGYDYVDGSLIVNEYEAIQIQDLYHRFLQGYAIHNCWQYMQKTYTNKYGGWRNETVVRAVLQNEVYTGKVKFNGKAYPGRHQPIITEDQFKQVQMILKNSRQNAGTLSRSPFRAGALLSSLVYCGKCGARFHKEHGNYSCYSRTKGDKHYVVDPGCRNKKWKLQELDSLVVEAISALDFSKLKKPKPDSSPIENHKKRLEEIQRQMSKLIDLYQIDGIPMDQVSMRMEGLIREREVLEKASKPPAGITGGTATPEEREAVRTAFLSLMEKGSLEEKRACLALLVDKIIVTEQDVNIILKDVRG